jgi:hypothetical protein
LPIIEKGDLLVGIGYRILESVGVKNAAIIRKKRWILVF